MLPDNLEGCLEEEAIELGVVGGRIYTKRRRARRSLRAKGLAKVERTECADKRGKQSETLEDERAWR